MSETGPALAHSSTYAEQAMSIRELAAQAKFAEVRAQLLAIAALYEKLGDVLRHAALHSLTTMASTLHHDSNSLHHDSNSLHHESRSFRGDSNSLHGDLLIPPGPSLDESSRGERGSERR
jgi:hypothetical protein